MKLQTNYINLYTPFFPLRRWKKFYKLRPEGKYTAAKSNPQIERECSNVQGAYTELQFLQNTVTN